MSQPPPNADELVARLLNRQAVVGIVGLGYVGLPLLLAVCRAGFTCVGFDIDPAKIEALRKGETYIRHLPSSEVREGVDSGRLRATADFAEVARCDAIILCVPTPLTPNRDPDLSFIEGTARSIAPHLRRGQLVSLESSTYPGTTREVMVPILEEISGLRACQDFFVAYSPEREDPNNREFTTARIPKVVGGMDAPSLRVACALYDQVVAKTVPVSSPDAAEATKLLENIFRCVNIAMVNELKMVFHRMGIDVWEVIEAARTKPFGFMPFYPGPGLGGHCIPIDPFYLTWRARAFDMPTRFIELAGEVNSQMPAYVVSRTMEVLNDFGKALKGSRLLIIGLAYKKDVDDQRESPTFKLIELFEARGATTAFHDPFIPEIQPTRHHPHLTGRRSVPLERLADYDAVIISTNHSTVDYDLVGREARLVIDTRNAMVSVAAPRAHVAKS